MSIRALLWSLDQEVFPSSNKFVLVALANFASETGKTYPSIDTISKITSQKRNTICSALDALERQKLIEDTGERAGQTHSIKVYRLPENAREAVPKKVLLEGEAVPKQYRSSTEAVPFLSIEQGTINPKPSVPPKSSKPKIESYEASDRAKMFGCKWWKTHPEPKGVDRIKAKIRELRELDGLFDSGVSEDQISRAWSILSADSFRKSWVANFSQMALNWQKIEMQCNGHLKPSVPVCRSWAKEKTPKEMWDDWDEYVKACTAAGDKVRFTAPTVPRP